MQEPKIPKVIRKKLLAILITLLTLLVGFAQQKGWLDIPTTLLSQSQPGLYAVTEFIDGDTIAVDMNGKSAKIRFIGVDTPETHDPRKAVQCFGVAAASFTKNLIGSNRLRLEADPLNTDTDRYGRYLRYIYLPDNTLVNAEIIKQGYGFAYTGFPFTKSDEFIGYQKQAREQGKGLWASCTPTVNDYGGYTSNEAD